MPRRDDAMTRVRVPNRPESAASKALESAIQAAASQLGISPGMAGMVVSHVFEQIALRISRGDEVRVMGFGQFAARWFHPQHAPSGHALPYFSPARGLRHEVKACCLRGQIDERSVRAYRKRHRSGSVPNRSSQRTWTAQQHVRKQILHRNYGSIELD